MWICEEAIRLKLHHHKTSKRSRPRRKMYLSNFWVWAGIFWLIKTPYSYFLKKVGWNHFLSRREEERKPLWKKRENEALLYLGKMLLAWLLLPLLSMLLGAKWIIDVVSGSSMHQQQQQEYHACTIWCCTTNLYVMSSTAEVCCQRLPTYYIFE